jgi:hypothetical protein
VIDALELGCFEEKWALTMKEVMCIHDMWLWEA